MSKVAPSFPLLREDQTLEELEANRQYCRDYQKRLQHQIKLLERHILLDKIKNQPFF